MDRLTVLADMAGQHAAHDVYDLWLECRNGHPLFGWDRYDGGQCTFAICPDGPVQPNGPVQPVGRPWSEKPFHQATSLARWGDGRALEASHQRLPETSSARFGIHCVLDGTVHELSDDGASLLNPTVCATADGTPWMAWIRCVDVENEDGVIDQVNQIECARFDGGEWVREIAADLRYGLLPKAAVWGYPGKRRRPYLVPDDEGALWLLWERKEPHDGATTLAGGALCARAFHGGRWHEPVRLVEGDYMDYAPCRQGVRDGRLPVAAQKGQPHNGRPGRGEVVVLEVQLEGAQPLVDETDFGHWSTVNLCERALFRPPDREVSLGDESYSLLFGDPHTHTALSEDAEGELDELLDYARAKAQLDYVAITDNDFIYGGRLSDASWHETMAREQAASEDGAFIAVPGYEWTQARWGAVRPQHRSILFGSYEQSILRWEDIAGDPVEALTAWIETTDGVMNTQHAYFQLTDSSREANMEVCCGWGDYINHSPCFHDHLDQGFRAGFVGTSDGHRRTPGLGGGITGLWVREFTLAGIVEAFRQRRCYATAGARIGLSFWIDDAFMGGATAAADTHRARVVVQAPREVERLEVFGDGQVVACLEDLPASVDETLGDLPPCAWYYAKVTLPGGFPEYPSNIAPAEGPWAWSSPVFVDAAD